MEKEIFCRLKAGKEDIPKLDTNPHILVLGEVGRGKNFRVSFMPIGVSVDKGQKIINNEEGGLPWH
ncbi:hypothetical protein [Streptococcus sanguinis]|uniref:hypothetical protein n=1 Tax=Streptococcus sanguinis TaxID=1305 RepID=UPI001CBB89A0|nr:hypothetical protein [Streptococcus sanguinis]MBZ2073760.1 hypothetical protein [Streptococcus sanguinis]MBZ2081683.1 hypothetical protein [Streptococcus sanguinis]MCC3165763.1 hypothetical protein [Streptococcus sanguinis]